MTHMAKWLSKRTVSIFQLLKEHFFFCLFIYFTLQYCIGFVIHWLESATSVHVFPLLPPHPIPLGHPSAPAPSTLYHASNLDWQFISHMTIYMFQCHFPKPSHPRPLPLRKLRKTAQNFLWLESSTSVLVPDTILLT